MKTVNIYEAKTNLSRLVERAQAGEDIVIARAGKPLAKLVRYIPQKALRKPGAWKGKVHIAKDFDVLPETLMAAFREDDR